MDSVFKPPFERIAAFGSSGGRLILRLRDDRGRWLRVHDDGALESATGDPREDESRSPLRVLALEDPLFVRARALHAELRGNFRPDDLLTLSPWGHFYPVQAFEGTESPVIEGYVGVESEMGAMTDVFGFRDDTNARSSVWTLQALLALLG